eukprot:TRINITY_DN7460_c0_g1_i3.p1 TRINITY_DN7460_c0_g1~~TRINITY_DN7460_c0_g1_i3.p1  ORF type:complete len:202 (-),score=46.28 TRINITY_DN7460_c0_g1_i3:33-551(-)
MSKANFDEECKICAKPFTVFCWTPGKRERRKKTEICQICAKLKNLCQSCILDLQYKAPFEIRDALIEGWNYTTNKKQQTEVHREYFALQAAKKVEQNDIPDYSSLPKVQTSNIIFPNVHPYYHPNQPVNVPTLQFPTISEEISSQNPYALDPNNKTVFIGGINDTITEEDLR